MVSLFSLSLEISFDYCLLTQTRHTLAFLREILAADHLLSPEGQAKLSAFKACAVTHPWLEKTGTALTQALREPAGFAHVLLYGPTGVGKTTVLTHATAHLSPFFLSQSTLA